MVKKDPNSEKHDIESVNIFIDEFMEESDRAAVVLGAAKLDSLLYQILKKVLQPCPENRDELFDGNGPLSTFSAKIDITFRLGLIDSALARSLHLMRKIRNSFAHEISGCDLKTGGHRDRVRELVAQFHHFEQFKLIKKKWEKKWDISGPSLDFRLVLGATVARLEGLFTMCDLIRPPYRRPLIPEEWKVNNKF